MSAPLTLEGSIALVKDHLAHREDWFLSNAERLVYSRPDSPWAALLGHAGCELDDLRLSVRRLGLEGALHELREAGVYLTYEEFKGKRVVVGGGRTFHFKERD